MKTIKKEGSTMKRKEFTSYKMKDQNKKIRNKIKRKMKK